MSKVIEAGKLEIPSRNKSNIGNIILCLNGVEGIGMEMEDNFIMAFSTVCFMEWYANAVSSKKIIKEIGFHKKYYPKKYIMPSRKMRKIFKLKKQEIPKWIYMNFYISFIFLALFIVGWLLYFLLDNKQFIERIFFGIAMLLMCVDEYRMMICVFLYTHNKK